MNDQSFIYENKPCHEHNVMRVIDLRCKKAKQKQTFF